MRILIISNLFPPDVLGGYEILCEQITNRFHECGHDLCVLTTGVAQTNGHPYPVVRSLNLYLPFSHPARFAHLRCFLTSRRNYQATVEAIRSFRPDLIFIWSQLRLTLGSAKAAEESGFPVAYTINDEHIAGYLSRHSGWIGWFKELVDSKCLDISANSLKLRHTTCISQTVKRRLCEQGIAISSAKVIFQGIPIEKFPSKLHPGSLETTTRVLYVGQLHNYKGVHTVVKAIARLHQEGLTVRLTICGKGTSDYENHLKALAESTDAEISFLGQVPHDRLPEIYRCHDIFVFPSTWAEPFGLTHLEAMASGTPVISTAEGGHGEFLRDNVNALIFAPDSDIELSKRIRELVEHPENAIRVATTARHQVEEEFSLEAYSQRLLDWLTTLR